MYLVYHWVLVQLSAEPVVMAIEKIWLGVEAEGYNYYRREKASGPVW